MSEAVGVVAFHGGFLDGVTKGWKQEWPPPELMTAAKSQSGVMSVVPAEDEQMQDLVPLLRANRAWLARYVRTHCSYDQPLIAHYGYDGALR